MSSPMPRSRPSRRCCRPSGAPNGRCFSRSRWSIAIRGGVFTPSEVGAFAVVYAIVIGVFAHRELDLGSRMKRAFEHAISDIGLIMIIILMSGMVGFAIIFMQVPQADRRRMLTGSAIRHDRAFILFILLVAGLFVESTVLVLLLTPIFVPIVKQGRHRSGAFRHPDDDHRDARRHDAAGRRGMYTVCSLLDMPVEEYVVEFDPVCPGGACRGRLACVFPASGAVSAQPCDVSLAWGGGPELQPDQ